jgi:hypothetical protein
LIVEYSFPPKDQMLSWLSYVGACSSVVLWYHLHLSVSIGGSDDSDGVHITAAYKVLKLQHKLSPQDVLVKLETLWAPSAWICLVGSRAAKEAVRRVVLYSDLVHCQMNELIARGHALLKNVGRKDSGAEWVSFQKIFVPSQPKHALLFGARLLTEAYNEDLHTPWDPDDSMY